MIEQRKQRAFDLQSGLEAIAFRLQRLADAASGLGLGALANMLSKESKLVGESGREAYKLLTEDD